MLHNCEFITSLMLILNGIRNNNLIHECFILYCENMHKSWQFGWENWFPKTRTKERNGKGARVVTRIKGSIFRKSYIYWENHCIVCVLSWVISYTWGFLLWECCWSVSGMIIIIVSEGKGDIFWEVDKILLSKERKSLWERRGNRKMGNRVLSAKLCTQVS